MLSPVPSDSPVRSAAGFTLVEVLVAVVLSVVVIGAASSILVIGLDQSSRINNRVQATQLGRIAMTKIVDELHSACLTEKFVPVQKGSTAQELWFIDAYGEEAIISKAYEHEIVWTGNPAKPKEPGQLIDYSYPNTSTSSWPKFEFAPPQGQTKRLLGEHIYMTEIGTNEFAPIFKYSKYSTSASSGLHTPLGGLEVMTPETATLTATTAAGVAAVTVSFTAAPVNNSLALSRGAPLSAEVAFALGAPSSEATITDSPCR
jgi:prepilin-type N-terminal cleavage/methylation domain-containing protein